jgi:N4-gp56 family major capsid protein
MASTLIASIPEILLEVYSRSAILAAEPLYLFRNFVELKTQLGEEAGEGITFLKYANIAPGGRLASETTPIPKQELSANQVSFDVYEYGNAVQLSRKALTASFRTLLDDTSILLGRDYASVQDSAIKDVFATGANVQYGDLDNAHSDNSQITTIETFNTKMVKDISMQLKEAFIPPRVRGGDQHYVCICHPRQTRKLKDDADWKAPHEYVDTKAIYNGEIGKFDNVVFIETTQLNTWATGGASSQPIYESFILGEQCVGYSETEPFQLVNDGIEDFGRFISLGWYSIFGAGIINDNFWRLRTS